MKIEHLIGLGALALVAVGLFRKVAVPSVEAAPVPQLHHPPYVPPEVPAPAVVDVPEHNYRLIGAGVTSVREQLITGPAGSYLLFEGGQGQYMGSSGARVDAPAGTKYLLFAANGFETPSNWSTAVEWTS